jgi:hypothetical protein
MVRHSKDCHMQSKVYHLYYIYHSDRNLLILDYTYSQVEYSKVLCHDALLQVHSGTQLHLVVAAEAY